MFEQFEVNSVCKSASTPRFNLCSSITSKLTAPFLLARLVLDPRAEVIGKKFLGVWAFWVWHHLTKKVPHFQWQQEHLLLRDHSCDFLSKISLIVCVFCLFVCFFPFFWDFSSFFFNYINFFLFLSLSIFFFFLIMLTGYICRCLIIFHVKISWQETTPFWCSYPSIGCFVLFCFVLFFSWRMKIRK